MKWRDLVWPVLEERTDREKASDAARLNLDLETIESAVISEDADLLIEQARRLADADAERRKTSETKATIYLTLVGVLCPILATIAPGTLSSSHGWPRLVVTLALFLACGCYLLRCGMWALRALAVRTSHRVDASELVKLWPGTDRKSVLARRLLDCVRRDRPLLNKQVTSIIMAQELAVRAIVSFILAMLLRSGWEPMAQVFDQVGKWLR